MYRGKSARRGVVVLAATAALVLVAVGGAPTAEAAATVDQCREINESVVPADRTVELNGSVTASGTCFDVTTSDVTVDGQGNTVTGPGSSGDGIHVVNASASISNVTVRNVAVTDFEDGVQVGDGSAAVSGTVVEDVNASGNNLNGVFVEFSATNTVVRDTVANDNTNGATGQGVQARERATVQNVTTRRNGENGIFLTQGATVVENSTSTDNVGAGVDTGAVGTVVKDTRVADNGGPGVRITDNDVEVRNVTANRNSANGLEAGANARILSSTFRSNGQRGIDASGSANNVTVVNVVVADNRGGPGIDLLAESTVRDSRSINNSNRGIEANENLTVQNVTVRDNGGDGITGSGALDIQDAVIRDNDGAGIVRSTATFGPYDATIRDVVVEGSTRAGISAAANVTVENATVVGSGDEGLQLSTADSASVAVRGATVRDSGGAGIETGSDAVLQDTTVSNSGGVDITTETNVTATNVTVGSNTARFASLDAANVTISQSNSTTAPPLPDGKQGVAYVEINSLAGTSGSFADVRIAYDDSNLGSIDESTLSLYRNDGSGWSEVSGARFSGEARTVSANITSFSEFAVYGDDGSGGGGGGGGGSSDDSSGPSGETTVTDASLSASTIAPGDSATVNTTVENTRNSEGAKTLRLRANNVVIAERTVYVAGDTTETFQFSYAPEQTGEYDVSVSGADAGTLTVEEGASGGSGDVTTTTAGEPTTTADEDTATESEDTATESEDTTDTAPPTTTVAVTDTQSAASGTETPTPTAGGGPGFGLVAALAGLLTATALLARRR